MQEFNPNDIGLDNGNLFGLPHHYSESEVVVLPVSWDVTVSYADGTSHAPEKIREESMQVDLYDLEYRNFWKKGIYYLQNSGEIMAKSHLHRPYALEVIKLLEKGQDAKSNKALKSNTEKVNLACSEMVDWVFQESSKLIQQGKKLVLLGGDHSTPLGYLKALNEKHDSFGILQIDAHCDLRECYEGFEYSHASIMHNAMKLEHIQSLTQVGIRDFCEEEINYAESSTKDIHIFFDRQLQNKKIEGISWKEICEEIVSKLPKKIYISFDIDGLKQVYCPHTGTPVAGGLEIEEVFYLFNLIVKNKIEIIGMDLNEVGNDAWDANVGARVLYRMIGLWLSQQ